MHLVHSGFALWVENFGLVPSCNNTAPWAKYLLFPAPGDVSMI